MAESQTQRAVTTVFPCCEPHTAHGCCLWRAITWVHVPSAVIIIIIVHNCALPALCAQVNLVRYPELCQQTQDITLGRRMRIYL